MKKLKDALNELDHQEWYYTAVEPDRLLNLKKQVKSYEEGHKRYNVTAYECRRLNLNKKYNTNKIIVGIRRIT